MYVCMYVCVRPSIRHTSFLNIHSILQVLFSDLGYPCSLQEKIAQQQVGQVRKKRRQAPYMHMGSWVAERAGHKIKEGHREGESTRKNLNLNVSGPARFIFNKFSRLRFVCQCSQQPVAVQKCLRYRSSKLFFANFH